MKQKTELAIGHVIDHLELGLYEKEWFCKDVCIVCELLRKLPEMEQALASGGLVKDNKGNWLKSGDKVKYKDDIKDDEFHFGTVDYDQEYLCWYLTTDDGYFMHLSKSIDQIAYFEKA